MTESKTPLTPEKVAPEKVAASATKISSNKSAAEKSAPKKTDSQKSTTATSSNKISKLAIFAIIIAIIIPAAHYYWQQLQHQTLTQTLSSKINQENSTTLNRYQNQLQQALSKQQQSFDKRLKQVTAQIQATSQAKIIELDASVAQLEQHIKQRQPSDWLLHEAEYLIRVAARTLWLEHDTRAAIGLLNDANTRLTELNDPAFLPVREIIHQDINALTQMPTLQTDEIVLTLMAMSKQVDQLSLAMVDLDQAGDKQADLTLSNDINDWQTNLAKTWQKFLNNFIRIRAKAGSIEPLMSPVQQANLKQNLSLKIQLALWAASERKGELYQKALSDIQQWLNDYFDMTINTSQGFAKTLADLKQKQVNYDYPSELKALTALRATLNSLTNSQVINQSNKAIVTPKAVTEKIDSEVKDTDTEKTEEVIIEPKKDTLEQAEQSKSEGSI